MQLNSYSFITLLWLYTLRNVIFVLTFFAVVEGRDCGPKFGLAVEGCSRFMSFTTLLPPSPFFSAKFQSRKKVRKAVEKGERNMRFTHPTCFLLILLLAAMLSSLKMA